MNSIKIFGTGLILLIIYSACGKKHSGQNSVSDSTSNAKDSAANFHKDTSFEARNYLWLSKLYLGDAFEDAKSGKDIFFRIAEIPVEENTLLYVEKISLGEEGGSMRLLDRYRLDETVLGKSNFSLHIDSLRFIDSVRVVGYFNKVNYTINLDTRTALKN